MKILKYGDGYIYWDISTPEKHKIAFQCLFDYLKEQNSFKGLDSQINEVQKRVNDLINLEVFFKEGKVLSLLEKEATSKIAELPGIQFHLNRLLIKRRLYDRARMGDS